MQIWRYALAHEVRRGTLSVQGSLVPLAPLPLTLCEGRLGCAGGIGDYQIAPIAARSTAMGRWRLTPPGYGGRRLRARDGEFRAPARVTFLFCKKKVTKENHLDLRSKDPLARCGSCRFGGVYSRAGCGGHHCRSKGLCLRSPARRLPRPLASATVGVFASTGWRLSNRAFAALRRQR